MRHAPQYATVLVAFLVAACATTPTPPLIQIPPSLKAECERPDPSNVATIGDLAVFSLKQDAAIRVCDAKREAVIAIAEASQPKPRKKRFRLW